MQDLVASVGKQLISYFEPVTPESGAVTAQIVDECVGMLDEGYDESAFNLVTCGGMNGPVPHIGEGHQVVPVGIRRDERLCPFKGTPQAHGVKLWRNAGRSDPQ
jgi:hypothetical protein